MHLFVFTNKFEGTPAERRGGAPEPHPVWTCHIQAHEKTELLMDAGCSLTLSPSLFLSVLLCLRRREGGGQTVSGNTRC